MNIIKVTRGYIANYLIPHYHKELKPIYGNVIRACGPVKVGSVFKNYIYGYHIEYQNQNVKDLWKVLPNLLKGAKYTLVMPDNHQRRQYDTKPVGTCFAPIEMMPINMPIISQCENFEDLYDYVSSVFTANGHANALLTVYDTAYRIGFNMTPQILPVKYVYLAAGAYDGALCLYGAGWIAHNKDKNFSRNAREFVRIPTKCFGSDFPNIDSSGIEALLCDFFNI